MAPTPRLKSYRAARNNELPVDDTLIDSYSSNGTVWRRFNCQEMNPGGRVGTAAMRSWAGGRKRGTKFCVISKVSNNHWPSEGAAISISHHVL